MSELCEQMLTQLYARVFEYPYHIYICTCIVLELYGMIFLRTQFPASEERELCVHKLLNINVSTDNFVCNVVIYLEKPLKIVIKHLISPGKARKIFDYTVACILNKINYSSVLVIRSRRSNVNPKIRKRNTVNITMNPLARCTAAAVVSTVPPTEHIIVRARRFVMAIKN